MAGDEPHTHGLAGGPADLRAKGKRLTRQRQLIWEAFTADPDRHLSADDVVERVRARLPNVNASTVYRTLDLLVGEGLLLRTTLTTDRAHYEMAREHAHHHLVCERCGEIRHFHDELFGDLRERIRESSGYELGAGEITLLGLCARCRAAGAHG